jgi:hypothetical protein
MSLAHLGFFAMQKGGADPHGTGAEHKRGRSCASVSYATCGDDRHLHRVDDLRQQREQARLHANVDAGESGAMTPRFGPCAMIASTPLCSSERASATVVALDTMKIPADLSSRITSISGRPK